MTDSDEDLNTRIDRLEAQMAHQDQTIDDLNETVTSQFKEIDALKRRLGKLDAELREIGEHPVLAGREPPPPHY